MGVGEEIAVVPHAVVDVGGVGVQRETRNQAANVKANAEETKKETKTVSIGTKIALNVFLIVAEKHSKRNQMDPKHLTMVVAARKTTIE